MQTIGSSPARQRRLGLGAHDGVGLAAFGAPLGMADDDGEAAPVLAGISSPVVLPAPAPLAVLPPD